MLAQCALVLSPQKISFFRETCRPYSPHSDVANLLLIKTKTYEKSDKRLKNMVIAQGFEPWTY